MNKSQTASPASVDYYSRGTNTTTTSAMTSRDSSPASSQSSPAPEPEAAGAPVRRSESRMNTSLSAAPVQPKQSKSKVAISGTGSSSSASSPAMPPSPADSPAASPATPEPGPTVPLARKQSVAKLAPRPSRSRQSLRRRSASQQEQEKQPSLSKVKSKQQDENSSELSGPTHSAASSRTSGAEERSRSSSISDSSGGEARAESQAPSSVAPSLASFQPSSTKLRVSKKRGKRQLKDKRVHLHPSGAPKRPPSSFGLFKHKLSKIKRRRKLTFEELNELALDKWNKMSSKHKRPFQERAKQLRDVFEKVQKTYFRRKIKRLRRDLGPEIVSPSPRGRRTRYIDRRRRSGRTNPFMLFTREHRQAIKEKMAPNSTVTEVAKEIGRQWKQLSDSERQSYIDRARKAAKKADDRMSKRLSKGKDPYTRRDDGLVE